MLYPGSVVPLAMFVFEPFHNNSMTLFLVWHYQHALFCLSDISMTFSSNFPLVALHWTKWKVKVKFAQRNKIRIAIGRGLTPHICHRYQRWYLWRKICHVKNFRFYNMTDVENCKISFMLSPWVSTRGATQDLDWTSTRRAIDWVNVPANRGLGCHELRSFRDTTQSVTPFIWALPK